MLLFVFVAPNIAQSFLSPSERFSGKKPAYLTLSDGTKVECTIDKIKRKKGLIKEIRVKVSGKKVSYKPDQIAFMYLMPSGFDKVAKGLDKAYDVQKWKEEEIKSDLLKEGYIYFEQTVVQVKKKERTMLMQLLNPHFAKSIRVYHDPWAAETMSVGVGSLTLAGGFDKSYYIKHTGDKVAFRLKKKKYKKEFDSLYDSCKAIKKEYKNVHWNKLIKHIIIYTEKCSN